jgi:hypothetical protein
MARVIGTASSDGLTSAQESQLSTAYSEAHTHDNSAILDAITAAFTTAYETKLQNITDSFKGVYDDEAALNTAYSSPTDGWSAWVNSTGTIWSASSGAWTDTTSSSFGDMLASTYDPQAIASDAFDRSNHTGTQAQSTIDGLEAALSAIDEAGSTISSDTYAYTASVADGNFVVYDGTNNRIVITDSTTRLLDFAGAYMMLGNGSDNYIYNPDGSMAVRANTDYTFLGHAGTTDIIMNSDGVAVGGYTGGSADTGNVGEVISNSYSGTDTFSSKNIYIDLTAGVWDVHGSMYCNDGTTEAGYVKLSINTTTSHNLYFTTQISTDSENDFGIAAPSRFFNLSTSLRVYLNYDAENSRGASWYMYIWARRVA